MGLMYLSAVPGLHAVAFDSISLYGPAPAQRASQGIPRRRDGRQSTREPSRVLNDLLNQDSGCSANLIGQGVYLPRRMTLHSFLHINDMGHILDVLCFRISSKSLSQLTMEPYQLPSHYPHQSRATDHGPFTHDGPALDQYPKVGASNYPIFARLSSGHMLRCLGVGSIHHAMVARTRSTPPR
jgi:hypothetical protein